MAKTRRTPEELADQLRTQIEYYFSDENWPNDKYLQVKILSVVLSGGVLFSVAASLLILSRVLYLLTPLSGG